MTTVAASSTPLPEGYKVRPGTPSDLDAVHALVHAVDLVVIGEPDTTREELEIEWERPRFDPRRDVDLVVTETGRVVGYLSVHEESPGIELRGDIYSHPELGAAVPINRHLAERAVVRAQTAADRAQSRMALVVYAVADEPLSADLASVGFEVRRRFWRMLIELDDLVLPPMPPDLDITPFEVERDVVEVHRVLTDAFADHWGSRPQDLAEWRSRFLERADADPALWRVARRNGEIVGAVVARADHDLACGWISTVGVRPDARGHGVADALLRATFAGLADRGMPRAMLGVDSQNETGATRLYERAGMRVQFEICAWVLDVEPSGERTA